jgi:cholesterol transport system auxiliary component
MQKKYVSVIVLAMSVSACSFGPVKVPNANTYRLTDMGQQTYPKPLGASLTVMPVVASRGFDSAAMMYQAAPYQLTSFAQNTWAAPPASMLTPLLLKSLQHSNLFHAVILGPAMNNTDYSLNTTLLALYQDFTVQPSQIVLSLDVSLGNNQSNQVVADRVMTIHVNATANNPYAGVVAANVALTQGLDDVAQFVNESL